MKKIVAVVLTFLTFTANAAQVLSESEPYLIAEDSVTTYQLNTKQECEKAGGVFKKIDTGLMVGQTCDLPDGGSKTTYLDPKEIKLSGSALSELEQATWITSTLWSPMLAKSAEKVEVITPLVKKLVTFKKLNRNSFETTANFKWVGEDGTKHSVVVTQSGLMGMNVFQ